MHIKSCAGDGHHCPDLSVAGVDFHKRHENEKCRLKSSSTRCSRPAPLPLPRLPRSPGSSVSITDSASLHLRSLLCLLKRAATLGGPLSSQTSWVRRAAHLPGGHLGLWGHGSVRWWLLSPELGALKSQAWPCPQGPPALPPLEPTALATPPACCPNPRTLTCPGSVPRRPCLPCGRSPWPRGALVPSDPAAGQEAAHGPCVLASFCLRCGLVRRTSADMSVALLLIQDHLASVTHRPVVTYDLCRKSPVASPSPHSVT